MSLETIESEIAALDDAKLRRLQAFILSLRQRRDPEWRAGVGSEDRRLYAGTLDVAR